MEIPLIGLGTYNLLGKECTRTVETALEIGYRHIDTAFAYENHKQIAKGIKKFDREKLFITTKFVLGKVYKDKLPSVINQVKIVKSIEKICDLALKELGVEYLDLLLIHWPDRSYPMGFILEVMWQLAEKGKIRYPGVSNYTEHHLQNAYDLDLKVPFNQVEFHPYLYQKKLLEFCRSHGTELISYRPFGKGKLLVEEPLFKELGSVHQKTPAQIILRWIIQKKIPVIPKASSEEHLIENFNIFDFTLDPVEEANIDQLNKNFRYCTTSWSEFDY